MIEHPTAGGAYRIIEELQPGRTHRAVDSAGNDVVLKQLDPACLQHGRLHPNVRERLERIRELPVRDLAVLHGVHVVDGEPVLVWDYLPGATLAETAPSSVDAAALARNITRLVEALHARGIVHGAIHAGNVIVDSAGRPWLTHLSPLLFYDPAADREQLSTMLNELGFVEPQQTLPSVAEGARWRRVLWSGSLWMALILTAAAIGAGVLIYRTVRPFEPRSTAALPRVL